MQQVTTRSFPVTVEQIVKVALAVCLLTLSAKVKLPFYPVPATMQVGVVVLIGAMGGLRLAAASVAAYLAIGAVGLPVFAGTPEKGVGLAYMLGTTGGYLAGFLLAASFVGWVADRFGKFAAVAAMPVGLALIYAPGVAWLAQFVPSDKLLAFGLIPFVVPDLLKIGIAAALTLVAPEAVRRWIKG